MTYLLAPYKPVEVNDLLLAFPAQVQHLMPEPDTFEPAPQWEELANDWFRGDLLDLNLLPTVTLIAADHSPEDAWRHLRCIMGSFEPKHEDKVAAVGFLLGQWFRWAQWQTDRGVVKKVGEKKLVQACD